MNRGLVVALVLSVAVNVGLVSAVAMHWSDAHSRDAAAWNSSEFDRRPEGERGPGRGGAGRRGPGWRPGVLREQFAERMFAHWPERRAERLAEHLDLSPEQRERLRRDLAPLRDELAELMKQLAEVRFKTAEVLAGETVDSTRAAEGARRAADLQGRIDRLVADAMVREARVLTPEQRRRLLDLEWRRGGP